MQQKVKIICDSWRKKDKDGQVCREDEVDPSVILTNFLFFARIILYLLVITPSVSYLFYSWKARSLSCLGIISK